MPYIVLADKLAFQKTMPDDPRMPDGPEEIVYRGNPVPDYTTEFTAASLLASGLIAWANQPNPVIVDPIPAQPIIPGQPVIQPSNPNADIPVVGDVPADTGDTPDPVTPDPVVVDTPPAPAAKPGPLPRDSDNKATWEAYAPSVGIAEVDAEAMTKADLVSAVKSRYAEATA